MLLRVAKVEETQTKAKSGELFDGIQLTGIKIGPGGENAGEYEKFIYEWKNPAEIEIIKSAGPGSTVELKFTKNGRWQELTEARIVQTAGPAAAQPTANPQRAVSVHDTYYNTVGAAIPASNAQYPTPPDGIYDASTLPAKSPKKSRSGDALIRSDALRFALDLTSMMLRANDYKKLLSPAKTNPAELIELTLENAGKFEQYINGQLSVTVKSDTVDLGPVGVDANEPSLSVYDDDDIPF